MDQGNFYILLFGAIGGISVIVAPLLKLNSNIVKLNANMEHLIENMKKHDSKIEKIEDELYDIKHEQANHETRLKSLENKV